MTSTRRSAPPAPYLLEEPTTGQYIVLTPKGRRLAGSAQATRFTTHAAAAIASGELQDVPHEIVRVTP